MQRINVGDTVEGTVKNLTDFGAFIDLGGADGASPYFRNVMGTC